MIDSASDHKISPKEDSDRRSIFENMFLISSVLGAVASYAATIAISHEIAFFYIVGIDFFTVMTTSDLIKSTAGWLPLTIVFVILFLMWEAKSPSYTPFLDNYYRDGLFSRKAFRNYIDIARKNKIYTIIILVITSQYFILSSWFTGLLSITFLLICPIMGRSIIKFREKYAHDVNSWRYMKVVTVFLILIVFGSYLGAMEGWYVYTKNYPVYLLRADKIESPLIVVVRTGEKGVIAKQKGYITFVPWDNVRTFSRSIREPNSRSIIGGIYHRIVDPVPPEI